MLPLQLLPNTSMALLPSGAQHPAVVQNSMSNTCMKDKFQEQRRKLSAVFKENEENTAVIQRLMKTINCTFPINEECFCTSRCRMLSITLQ